jgi:hypothetical protein
MINLDEIRYTTFHIMLLSTSFVKIGAVKDTFLREANGILTYTVHSVQKMSTKMRQVVVSFVEVGMMGGKLYLRA